MAKSENNEVMFGARGKIGNLVVFKNFGENQTVISKIRKKAVNPRYTIDQERTKDKFREGVAYAKGVIADADLTAMYKVLTRPGISVYNLALADFCKSPEIKAVDHSAYTGAIGDFIRIRVVDNFRVTRVKLSITSATGTPIESGEAVMLPNTVDWRYQCTTQNPELSGTSLIVEAYDVPGNLSLEVTAIP